jgi:hypothetical protein
MNRINLAQDRVQWKVLVNVKCWGILEYLGN